MFARKWLKRRRTRLLISQKQIRAVLDMT